MANDSRLFANIMDGPRPVSSLSVSIIGNGANPQQRQKAQPCPQTKGCDKRLINRPDYAMPLSLCSGWLGLTNTLRQHSHLSGKL